MKSGVDFNLEGKYSHIELKYDSVLEKRKEMKINTENDTMENGILPWDSRMNRGIEDSSDEEDLETSDVLSAVY
jgi:hypothetical protein